MQLKTEYMEKWRHSSNSNPIQLSPSPLSTNTVTTSTSNQINHTQKPTVIPFILSHFQFPLHTPPFSSPSSASLLTTKTPTSPNQSTLPSSKTMIFIITPSLSFQLTSTSVSSPTPTVSCSLNLPPTSFLTPYSSPLSPNQTAKNSPFSSSFT